MATDYCGSYSAKSVPVEEKTAPVREGRKSSKFLSEWEQEEHDWKVARLKKLYPLVGPEVCAERLGMTQKTINRIIYDLRAAGKVTARKRPIQTRLWPKMDPILREKYLAESAENISLFLSKEFTIRVTKNMVIGRAHRLGLFKRSNGRRL